MSTFHDIPNCKTRKTMIKLSSFINIACVEGRGRLSRSGQIQDIKTGSCGFHAVWTLHING